MIIAISGKLKSGKDTIADYLVQEYGFKRIAFADKLKDIAKDLFFWDGNKDDYGRKLLQDLGMQMRSIKQDVWVDYVFRTIRNHNDMNWVITDVRYKNEAEIAHKNRACIWRVNRELDRSNILCNHISETDLDDYNYFDDIIENVGTVRELYDKVDKLFLTKGESHVIVN